MARPVALDGATAGCLPLPMAMTWEELTGLLIELGERIHVVRGDGLDAVSLQLPPVAWFIAPKAAGTLNVGTYQGPHNGLVGTEQIPLEELTAEIVRAKVEAAIAEQVERVGIELDPEAVAMFFQANPGARNRLRGFNQD